MSKFLTPPVWYDKDGEENQSLVNTAGMGISGPTNIAFGLDAKSGADNDSHSCIAIGYEATATGKGAIAIGSYDSNGNPVAPSTGASAIGPGTIAIGGAASATDGSLAIGDGASAIVSDAIAIGGGATAGSHQIQLGGNNNLFNLTVGNGTGTIQAGGYKIGTTTIIDSNRNISGNSFLSTSYIQCPVLQILPGRVGYGNFTQSEKKKLITITIGDSDNALYLITIMARHDDETYRQHFGFISSSKFPPKGTPDTAIEVPMIVKVNEAPYNNNWSVAYFEFSPNTKDHPLYCDFTKVIRDSGAMTPYDTNVLEVWVYVHKIINFPNPLTT